VIQFYKINTFIVEPVLYSWGEGLGRQLLYVRVDNQQNQEQALLVNSGCPSQLQLFVQDSLPSRNGKQQRRFAVQAVKIEQESLIRTRGKFQNSLIKSL
jgi:hypothetical protein